MLWQKGGLKVGLQILGRKFYKNTKKSSLPQNLLIFIHETPVVENHPTTGEIRELLRTGSTPTGITVCFLHEQHTHLHTANTQKKVSNIASDEDPRENNYMCVMLWNLSVISHLIFPQCFFFPGTKSENNLRGYVAY